jgi:nucleoid-associated protein EbfC
MNLKKMMQQAQKMQEQMMAAQEEVAKKTVEATAGEGKVTVVATGGGDIVSLKIAKEIVDPEDVEFLERLILEAVKKAIEDARAMQQGEMGKFIPPGMGGLGL